MNLVKNLHAEHVFKRRIRVLTEHLGQLLPENARLLDVGCGDGSIDSLIQQQRPDVTIEGVDVFVREQTAIPVTPFDGDRIPFPDNSFDVVMFVDVLHHTDSQTTLLKEARRVARDSIILKDHTRNGFLAGTTLRLMDWVGNAPHGVVLPYNYWQEQQWRDAFAALDLNIQSWTDRIGLYPWPASLLFDRSLHFIAKLVH